MNIYELNDFYLIINGLLILISIYIIRFTYLAIFKKEHILPEGFVSPRGLISILLYYNLPENMRLPEISTAFLFMVVLGTSLVMTFGLMTSKKNVKPINTNSV